MSHFAVMVIGESPEAQLAQYDESLEMPLHIYETKTKMIKRLRRDRESYAKGPYANYLKDKEAYKLHSGNPKHIEYLEETFPKILKMNDEELYQRERALYQQDIGIDINEGRRPNYGFDDEGNLLSTFNEKAKWDWYVIGGRYEKRILTKDGEWCDSAIKSDIANLDELGCFAYVKDYEWYERGQMGWWAKVSNEMDIDEWNALVTKMLSELPDDEIITYYDCHI